MGACVKGYGGSLGHMTAMSLLVDLFLHSLSKGLLALLMAPGFASTAFFSLLRHNKTVLVDLISPVLF